MIIRHGRAVSQGKQGLFWGGAAGGLPSPSSLTRVHLPQRGRQDLVFCKPLVGCPLRPLRGHSRLPARVMQPSGLRPSPTDAAAETKR